MALHAVVLGARSKAESTEADANSKNAELVVVFNQAADAAEAERAKAVSAAEKTRDVAMARQGKRITDVKEEVAKATRELNAHQEQAKKDLGIEIPNYLEQAVAGGGSVKL